MVVRYDGGQAIFSTIKVNLADKMKRCSYLRVVLHVKQKKLPILKSKKATMFDDVTGLQQSHHP